MRVLDVLPIDDRHVARRCKRRCRRSRLPGRWQPPPRVRRSSAGCAEQPKLAKAVPARPDADYSAKNQTYFDGTRIGFITFGQISVNTEYGSSCNPYGGHGVSTANTSGVATDQWFLVAIL
jgi:hypothetical protein